MKTNQEKQMELTKERDDLHQELKEKQTFIESMMKVNIFLLPSFTLSTITIKKSDEQIRTSDAEELRNTDRRKNPRLSL